HTHVLETKVQLATGRELYGKSLIEHLRDCGALNERLTIAHAIWITDAISSMSASVIQIAWAIVRRSLSAPQSRRCSIRLFPYSSRPVASWTLVSSTCVW